MKGVILAGGTGSRLMPLTAVANKNLLPIYDRPMLFYPIEMMVKAGVRDLLIVTGTDRTGDLLRVLGDGSQFGLHRLYFAVQDRAAGIAHALSFAEALGAGVR